MLKSLTDTAKDLFTKPNVTAAQKDDYVAKLKQAGEFDKAKAVSATDYRRDKSLKTIATRGVVNLAFFPIALPLIFGRNFTSNLKSVWKNSTDGNAEKLMAETPAAPSSTKSAGASPTLGGTSS
jgi:hypothetical protein